VQERQSLALAWQQQQAPFVLQWKQGTTA